MLKNRRGRRKLHLYYHTNDPLVQVQVQVQDENILRNRTDNNSSTVSIYADATTHVLRRVESGSYVSDSPVENTEYAERLNSWGRMIAWGRRKARGIYSPKGFQIHHNTASSSETGVLSDTTGTGNGKSAYRGRPPSASYERGDPPTAHPDDIDSLTSANLEAIAIATTAYQLHREGSKEDNTDFALVVDPRLEEFRERVDRWRADVPNYALSGTVSRSIRQPSIRGGAGSPNGKLGRKTGYVFYPVLSNT